MKVNEKEYKDYHLVIELTTEEVSIIYKELLAYYDGTHPVMNTFFEFFSRFVQLHGYIVNSN
jgi:hypothetical protein